MHSLHWFPLENQSNDANFATSSLGTCSGNPGWLEECIADWNYRRKGGRLVHGEGLCGWADG